MICDFSKVVELAWNIDSTVLAAFSEELQSQDLTESQFVPKSYGKFKSHYCCIVNKITAGLKINSSAWWPVGPVSLNS